MTDRTALASPDDMRRRPGMYGEVEAAMWFAIDHLLFLSVT
ncbi:hypothetical protein [Streptomyces sp. Ag109_G2-15]|nr:hypothetical protein [Streptomyces sp. Ag109_G2-15]